MSTFTVINEATLVQAMGSCERRLVYIAPGVTAPIAAAMNRLMTRADPPALTVIVDTDPEVCRLGYGTLEGLKALQALAVNHKLAVRFQAGLRLGVLVCDEDISVYSPTPLLIEAGSDRTDQPNAIQLGAVSPLKQVLKACAAEGEVDANIPLAKDAEIGAEIARPEQLQATVQDLERLPPKPFDVARTERVYNTKLQYVEFEVTGYKLAARRVQIPTDLLLGNEKTLEARLRNTFSLLEGKEALVVQIVDANPATGELLADENGKPVMADYSELSIERERKQIHVDFLTPIAGHGQLIPKIRRSAFDIRIKWFEARVTAFSVAVSERLAKAIEVSVDDLTEALLPGIMKNPPERLMKHSLSLYPTEDDYRAAVKADLAKAFNLGERFFRPAVKLNFKDLTYETISDPKFRGLLNQAFPTLGQQGIFDEHDAAPELTLPAISANTTQQKTG